MRHDGCFGYGDEQGERREYIFEREISDDFSVMSQEKDGIQNDDSFLA